MAVISPKEQSFIDVLTDTWDSVANIPTSRMFPAACVLDGKIYVIGGHSQNDSNGNGIPVVERYDPETDIWDTCAPFPTGDFASLVLDGEIWAIGGSPDAHGSSVHLHFEVYNPQADTWTMCDNEDALSHTSRSLRLQ